MGVVSPSLLITVYMTTAATMVIACKQVNDYLAEFSHWLDDGGEDNDVKTNLASAASLKEEVVSSAEKLPAERRRVTWIY